MNKDTFTREYDDTARELLTWYADNRNTIPANQREHVRAILDAVVQADPSALEFHFPDNDRVAKLYSAISEVVEHYGKPPHRHSPVDANIVAAKERVLDATEKMIQASQLQPAR